MNSPVATCVFDTSVGRAREIMQMKACHALPLVEVNGEGVKLKGIVTSQDLVGVIDENVKLTQVSTKKVTIVQPNVPVQTAAKLMLDNNIHHLVVKNGSEIVGMVSSFDFVRLVADQ
jgi:CBS domain-containing protein